MRKIFTLVALTVISAMSWAASITVNPTTVDFGEVSIKGQALPMYGSQTITVTWSGLTTEGTSMWAEITEGVLDDETNPNGFYVGDPDYVYLGYGGSMLKSCEFQIGYGVKAAGTYSGKLHLYAYDTNWNEVHKYVDITITVTDEAITPQTTPFERLNSTSDLKDGDTIVFVSEASLAVGGPLFETYLPEVTENVSIDASAGTADIPEEAQFFRAKKYSGNWQFFNIDTDQRLHLDVTGKGAFTYADTQAGAILASWGVSISNGAAVVSRPDDEQSFAVEFNAGRFKPYKNPQGSTIQLYKKAGATHDVEAKLEVEDVVFGDVELGETAEVTVNYTAENLTDDIIWEITGADANLFEVADQGDRTSGTVTVTYKGNGTKTGSVNAQLAYLTLDAKLDPMEGAKSIVINLIPTTIKLTKLEFVGAPTTIDQGQTIDLAPFVVYTPDNAADKSLTWSVDHTYQGEVDQEGKLTAKHVTGTVTVTATSVRVPSVSANVTLTITKPTITDFTLSKSEVTLNIGGQETLTITAFVPEYASASATWASNNASIAKVSSKGVITAMGLGDTEITATIGEVVKSCTVHVIAVAVNSISLPEEANLTLGSSLQLNPTVDPAQAASEYTIGYESSNPEVATVDANGKVTSVAEGDAVITATIADKSAQITIHVIAAQTFAKVTDASQIAAKDTIILALHSVPVIAGAQDGKKLTVLLEDVTVTKTEAYADDALRLVVGTIKNKSGFSLQPVGSDKVLAENNNDLYLEKTTSTKNLTWQFVADGSNGIYVQNVGNANAMFKYHAGNAAIKPYKANTAGAVYVYVYVRPYKNPQGIEDVESETKAQKILRDGQILIIRNDAVYTITGMKIE